MTKQLIELTDEDLAEMAGNRFPTLGPFLKKVERALQNTLFVSGVLLDESRGWAAAETAVREYQYESQVLYAAAQLLMAALSDSVDIARSHGDWHEIAAFEVMKNMPGFEQKQQASQTGESQ